MSCLFGDVPLSIGTGTISLLLSGSTRSVHRWPLIRPFAPWRSDVEADLAEVLMAFLITECFDNVLQWEMTVDDRPHSIHFDGADHLGLLAAAPDEQRLQTQLPRHRQP